MDHLSPRERQALDLVCQGLGNKEVAAELGIATNTQKNHMTHVYQKMHVTGQVGACVLWAIDAERHRANPDPALAMRWQHV